MTNKNKFFSVFSVFWFSLTNRNRMVIDTLLQSEPVIVETVLQSFEQEKTKTPNNQLQHLINELNELKVHILVTAPFQKENEKDIFLSLMSEARLDSEQALIDYRHRKLFLTRSAIQPLTHILKKDRYSIAEILRANRYPIHAKTYRNAKSYSIENSCGYKSICPIFFDKVSAEKFLIKSSRKTILLLRNMPLKSNKEILKGFLNTKVKTIGLGSLMEHFANDGNETLLNTIEFLFVPCIDEDGIFSSSEKKKIEDIIKNKNFAFYHNEFLKLQNNNEDPTAS